MPTPVRFPGGVTNAAPFQTMGQAGIPDPSYYHTYFNDFDRLAPTDFIVTDVGTNTTALTAGDGGLVITTTSAGATDSSFHQLPAASFALTPATSNVSGKKTFFKIEVALSDATNSTFIAGLCNTNTTPLTSTDGIYFLKAAGAATFILRHSVGGVNTDVTLTGFTFANATFIELGFMHDGKGNIYAFVNPSTGYYPQSGTGATNVVTANKGAVAVLTPASLTTANLNLTFGIQNGAAASKTMTLDYVLAAGER